MKKKIALESMTVLLICACLLLLKVIYPQPAVEAKATNDNISVKQSEVVNTVITAIDINLATQQELQQIPGVGEVIAARIIKDRAQNGYYQTTNDIVRVKGIGPKTYLKMKHLIIVNKRNLMLYLGY